MSLVSPPPVQVAGQWTVESGQWTIPLNTVKLKCNSICDGVLHAGSPVNALEIRVQ